MLSVRPCDAPVADTPAHVTPVPVSQIVNDLDRREEYVILNECENARRAADERQADGDA
jgi:hypothetical protein